MKRVFFKKGEQRRFIKKVIENTNSPSLRGLIQFGLPVNYSSLKNYYVEARLLPLDLFEDLCYLGNIDKTKLSFGVVCGNWGQVKGGKLGKKLKS